MRGSVGGQINTLLADTDGKTRRELRELTLPLRWGEVLYYYYDYLLSASRDKKSGDFKEALLRKKRLDRQLYPVGENYCFDCDEPILVTKYHPSQTICRQCATKRRVALLRSRVKPTG